MEVIRSMFNIIQSVTDENIFIKELSMEQLVSSQRAVTTGEGVDLAAELIWRSCYSDASATVPVWSSREDLMANITPKKFTGLTDEILQLNGLAQDHSALGEL